MFYYLFLLDIYAQFYYICHIMYISYTFSEILVSLFYYIILKIRANDLVAFRLTKLGVIGDYYISYQMFSK